VLCLQRFVGVVGKFRTIDAAVAVLVCLSCRYWADGMGHGAAQLVHVTRSVVLPVNSNPLARACLYELGPCIGLRAVAVPYGSRTVPSMAWMYPSTAVCRIGPYKNGRYGRMTAVNLSHCILADNPASRILLGLEDPLGPNDIRSRRRLLKLPGACSFQRRQLLLNRLLP